MFHNHEDRQVASLKDERGFNQGFEVSPTNYIRMQRRWDFIIERLRKEGGIPADLTVLELGCSHGQWTRYLVDVLGCHAYGLDISELFVSMANERLKGDSNPSYACLDFMDEGAVLERFEPQTFDAIVGNGVLHHFEPDLDKALRLMYRLLKPGGRIVFIEPNLVNPYVYWIFSFGALRRLASLEPNEMAFTRWSIQRRLKQAGFLTAEIQCADFLLPGTPEWLVKPSIAIGTVLEKTPLREIAQSVFLVARK